MDKNSNLVKELQRQNAELKKQVEYYQFIATDIGQKRFRDVDQLNQQIRQVRQAEKEVQLSYKLLMTVMDSVDAGIFVADLETYEILFLNKKMVETFGSNVIGRPCWDVIANETGPCKNCNNHSLLDDKGQPTGLHTSQGQNKRTGKYYVNYDRAIQWHNGRMVKVQSTTDITQIKSMEAQLRQKYKMEAIGTMAGGIAHDFNNILAIIMTNLELIHRKLDKDNPILPRLLQAKSASIRASELVKQILSYSRQTEQKFCPLQLSSSLEESLKLVRSTTPASIGIIIHIDEKARNSIVKADATQIDEILLNLCNNAVYAMQGKGELKVSLTRETLKPGTFASQPQSLSNEWLKLSISDTGPGLPPNVLEKIFDPFFTTKPVGEGTGMGLSICYGIAQQHKGFIVVDSTMGQGSTFSVYFPTVKSRVKSTKSQVVKKSLGGNERILLLDDEVKLTSSVSEYLTEYGYHVTVENNSRAALELFYKKPDNFDVVITDQRMPGITGIEFAQKLLKIKTDLPIILCTGFSDAQTEKKAKDAGIKAFLMKPLSLQKLLEETRSLLENKRICNCFRA
jgi:signal transduction histidine kinase/ActR/RegA family two-component response regulator